MNNLPQFEVSNVNLKPKGTTKFQIVHIPSKRMYSFLVIFQYCFNNDNITLLFIKRKFKF